MSTAAVETRDPGDLLAASTDVAAVTLHAGDLGALTSYYRDALALPVIGDDGGRVVLGRRGVPSMILVSSPGLPTARRNEAGLFHTAFLFPDEATLAATVLRAAQDPRSRFVGVADHGVSNAFYFTDPEGNGIELYWDRPRSDWQVIGGQIQMNSDPLDANAFLTDNLTEAAVRDVEASVGAVGHVHLQVGDTALAKRFYVDALGFETTFETPGALFVSAGGYHHHLAMNVWNSRGAGPRAATLGLAEVAITVPGRADLDAVSERMRRRGIAVADDGDVLRLDDPWRNPVTVRIAA